ncbi:3-hydroxyacyl-ACP dehydratase FabZ family protein [Peribacillus frigoritolerans]|uniref:3-hydroxyacyl-ACP dehydratase FabZ family protein n=1 Tax=Peribacillus frigoritolerans TaxID=450367 RepID=UPI0023DC98E4|nr:3-hydroxyacyl-ACP dehydratase FabZ family protein [Peribacillus frigoritolerans]MDF1999840.1 beta-hydroxyacyl-ACP dehydratase [Peribacillus frigoritolerans]
MNEEIKMIPHAYPMLMIDRIVEKEPFKWVKGYKNISANEWFMNRHSPLPSMPSVLIIEAIGQIGAYVLEEKEEEKEEETGILAAINGVTIHGEAIPGDRLDLFFEVTKQRKGIFRGRGTACVNGQLIVEVEDITVLYIKT